MLGRQINDFLLPCRRRARSAAERGTKAIHRELRHVSPDVKIDTEEIKSVLTQEVLKRDVIEGEKADEARKKINRAMNRYLKAKAAGANGGTSSAEVTGDQRPSENGPVAGTAKPTR